MIRASASSSGKGNGNPLQCFSWRIPGMGEPGGAAVYGIAQSRTRMKWLSSSSSASSRDVEQCSNSPLTIIPSVYVPVIKKNILHWKTPRVSKETDTIYPFAVVLWGHLKPWFTQKTISSCYKYCVRFTTSFILITRTGFIKRTLKDRWLHHHTWSTGLWVKRLDSCPDHLSFCCSHSGSLFSLHLKLRR